MSSKSQDITGLLQLWMNDRDAVNDLMPLVYAALRRIADRCMRNERTDHTLQATDLVHEAYFRLANARVSWQSRTHFYAIASRLLRQVLVEHARTRNRQKRGGGETPLPLDESMHAGEERSENLLQLDESLQRLAALDERKSDIVQLLFFGGMTYDEAAAALEISPATLHRELRLAKAWLHRDMTRN
jgi:RNA polymerase sigma factor (TIGR02999 family)